MIQVDLDKQYTVDEYLKLETQATLRHEYYYGNLFELPGTTILHNEICIVILMILKSQLSKEVYEILIESVKVRINNEDIFLYPDIMVTLVANTSKDAYVVKSPILIAEVLSDSTRSYDSTDKFIQYRKIESLQYYLLVEFEKQIVHFYAKAEDGDWIAKPFTDDNEQVELPLLHAVIPLKDIYDK